MEATSKENMAKTNISEEFGIPELKTVTKVNAEGGTAAPPVKVAATPVKIAGPMLKFPASLMDKDKILMFLLYTMLVLHSLSAYNGILHIGLHYAVSDPCALEEEVCPFFRVVIAVVELVASIFGLVYQILKFKWKRN